MTETTKPITKSEFLAEITENISLGYDVLTKKQAIAIMEGLKNIIENELLVVGKLTIPILGIRLTLVDTPAKPARKARNPFTGESIMVGPKPASKKVKARVLKGTAEDIIAKSKKVKKQKK